MNNNTSTICGQQNNTDWHRIWSEFNEGMKQLTDTMRHMEKTYADTFVWDRPIARLTYNA